jgi:O-antigen/teichoic acid export membrane protein
MTSVLSRWRNDRGLMYRAVLSSAFTVGGFGATQAIRLASNLILTRLLFPEAFGIIAIVMVFIVGLAMFSDVGTGVSIMQSKRGDDQDFLDTAWTVQIIRGCLLWSAALVLAWPVSVFYGEPGLMWYLPVAALSLLVAGFNPTRLQTAHRHLLAGRVTVVEILNQLAGVALAIILSILLHSVWALIISLVLGSIANLILIRTLIPGPPNRLRWEPAAIREMMQFGKWIFLATVGGFIVVQADKFVIGRYLSLAEFGLYSIGVYLATFPFSLGGSVFGRLLIPVYRESPPLASVANRNRVRKMRFGALGLLSMLVVLFAFGGVWLVELLYDDRYHNAAGVVVLVAMVQMPALVMLSCDQAALAVGDSRRYAVFALTRAVLMVIFLLAGLEIAGLQGAIIGQGLAGLAVYPAMVWLLRPHGAWDPLVDGLFYAIGLLIVFFGWQHNADAIAALATMGRS